MKKKDKEILLQGIAASSGIAIGPVYCYVLPDLTVPVRIRGSRSSRN